MLKQLPQSLDHFQVQTTASSHVPALRTLQTFSVHVKCQALGWTLAAKPDLGLVRMFGRSQQGIRKWRSWSIITRVQVPNSHVRIADSHVRISEYRSKACLRSSNRGVNFVLCQQSAMKRGQPWSAAGALGGREGLFRPLRCDR